MLSKQEVINYWKTLAEEDLATAMYNLKGRKALATLFFFHLAIEKLLKAHWIKDNLSNTVPFTHDLQKLITETNLEIDAEQFEYLFIINSWNIEARYPDYKMTLNKIATPLFLQKHGEKVNKMYQWLHDQI